MVLRLSSLLAVLMVATMMVVERIHAQPFPSLGCGGSSAGSAGSTTSHTITHDGEQRVYVVHLPTGYLQSGPGVPVVLGLPGYLTSAQYFSNTFKMNSHANANNYMAVYAQGTSFGGGSGTITWNDESCGESPGPDGPTCIPEEVYTVPLPSGCEDTDGNACNWCNCHADDVGFLQFLMDEVESTYCVDVSREYVLGFSQGGMMTHRMACAANSRFAAVAPFHGQLHVGFNCVPEQPNDIPICLVWGTSDTVVPGEDINGDGWLYLPVSVVADTFGTHNGCTLSFGRTAVDSVSDGTRGWACSAYTPEDNGCRPNTEVRICQWNGGHSYPTQGGRNFGLSAVWEFFQRFQRLPNGDIVENPIEDSLPAPSPKSPNAKSPE